MKIFRSFIAFALVCFALSPATQAVVPPPDGGYANFTTAEGDHALEAFTLGVVGNTAIGAYSLFSVTTGGYNTAVGAGALEFNTAENNTATGAAALLFNTTGLENTANGTAALELNETGNFNTASGAFALFNNTTGSENTANGVQALVSNTTGTGNTAMGSRALFSNTTVGVNVGSSNTAVGFDALVTNTTGFENTAVGYKALLSNDTTNFTTAVGAFALQNNITDKNTAVGWGALRSNTQGIANTANGVAALLSNTTGNNNTAIGNAADVGAGDLTNATAIGANAVVNASNKVRIGNSSVTVIEGQVAYTFSSDRNKKESFQPVDGEEVLRKIRQFNLTSWNYIGQDAKTLRHYGPMAQDFYEAFGHDAIGTVGTPKTINSGDMAGVMMIAIKTLATENEQLKSAVAKQEAVNAEQRKRLEALTARFEEQDKQIQTVSDELQSRKPIQSLARNIP